MSDGSFEIHQIIPNFKTGLILGVGRQIDPSTYAPIKSNKIVILMLNNNGYPIGCDKLIIRMINLYAGDPKFIGQLGIGVY